MAPIWKALFSNLAAAVASSVATFLSERRTLKRDKQQLREVQDLSGGNALGESGPTLPPSKRSSKRNPK